MTKSLSALLAVAFCVGLAQLATAQTVSDPSGDEAQLTLDRPASVFTDGAEQPERQMPGWAYDFDAPFSDVPPEVMERSINIALGLGVLGWDVRPYRVGLQGAGNVGLIPAPVPEGWVVIRRCMERGAPTAERPEGICYVYEMRELTGNPYAIAWD